MTFKNFLHVSITGTVALAFLAVWMSLPVTTSAQETVYSNIRGFVSDQAGLAIQGTEVSLLNEGTGVRRSTRSREDGSYLFDNIVPGVYRIDVELQGFKKYQRTGLDLTASKTIRIDIALEIGDVTESVTVVGETPVIETETPTVSFAARHALMNELPGSASVQGGRIPETMFHIIPGSASSAGSGFFNGLPAGGERNTLDGVKVVQQLVEPTLEAIAEMKVITHNATAEYSNPTTIQLTSQQGSNKLHGSAWWLYQDKGLDARDPVLGVKPFLHGHTASGSLGGPILKNKAFFYFGVEILRQNNSSNTAVPITSLNLPTGKMQKGDFSELLDPTFVGQYNQGRLVTVRDPLTGQPFSNNVIPSGRIAGVSQNVVSQYYVPPDGPGLVGNRFANVLRPVRREKYTGRVDYNVSPRHTFFASYFHGERAQIQPTTNIKLENTADARFIQPNRMVVFSDIFNFTPRVTNEFRTGYSWTLEETTSSFADKDIMKQLGINNTLNTLGMPGFSITGFTGIGARIGTTFPRRNLGFTDNISTLVGKHSVKAGLQFNRTYNYVVAPTNTPGFNFNGSLSGFSWADFLLGLPSSVSRSLAPGSSYFRQNEWGFFFQDEVRLRKNLTLNLGLRYSLLPYAYQKYDALALFDPTRKAIIVPTETAKSLVVPTFPRSAIPVLTAKEAGYPATGRSLTNTNLRNLQPRFGFAWRPFGLQRTTVRGGYGLYNYNALSTGGASSGGSVFAGSQSLTQQLGANGTLIPLMTFPDPFQAFLSAGVPTLNAQTLSLGAGDPNLKNSSVQDWSLSVEQEVLSGWGVRASYLGSAERNSQFSTNINEAPPSRLPFDQSRRPFPQVRDISYTQTGGSTMNHGLQVVVNRPMKRGLSLMAGYTWMKKLTDLNFVGSGAAYDRARFRSVSGFSTPQQQLILTYVWEVPVGRQRRFLPSMPGFAEAILGGWRILGITKFEMGQWVTPTYVGVDPTGATPGTGAQIPDRIGNGNLPRSSRNPFTGHPMFDTGAFVCPGGSLINGQPNLLTQGCPLSTPQNVGRWGNSAPNVIETPGINIWNLAVGKEFALRREGATLYLGAQISNPWNHPNWSSTALNLSSPATVGIVTSTRSFFLDPFSLGRRRIGLDARIKF